MAIPSLFWRRLLLVLLGLGALFAILAAGGVYFATRALHAGIVDALGPRGSVGSISLGLSRIEISDLRVKAAPGWPAADELRAGRVVVEPDLAALLSRQIRVGKIRVEAGYLSLFRQRDGKLLLVPSLLAAAGATAKTASAAESASPAPEIVLAGIDLADCALEFFDATVRQPALKLRLDEVQAGIGPLRLPEMRGRSELRLAGTVRGIKRDGRLEIAGWAEIASRDSELQTRLRGVDLKSFQPYLLRAAEAGVERGSLDLDLKSSVRQQQLRAPGKMSLHDLHLSGGGSFMGLSRSAVLAAMKNRQGSISVDFVLAGRLDDPKFSLNENFAAQVGSGVGNLLGVSLEGLAHGVSGVGGGAVREIGNAFGKLLGR